MTMLQEVPRHVVSHISNANESYLHFQLYTISSHFHQQNGIVVPVLTGTKKYRRGSFRFGAPMLFKTFQLYYLPSYIRCYCSSNGSKAAKSLIVLSKESKKKIRLTTGLKASGVVQVKTFIQDQMTTWDAQLPRKLMNTKVL